ncbi:MAG: hypothetical protein ACRDYE_09435 [Acidimicrobiales bacterium]
MRELVDYMATGQFADEWDTERDAGYPRLTALRADAKHLAKHTSRIPS